MFFPSRNIFFMLKFFPLLAYKMSLISYFVMELFFIFLLKYKVNFLYFFLHSFECSKILYSFLNLQFLLFFKTMFFLSSSSEACPLFHFFVSIIPRLLFIAKMIVFTPLLLLQKNASSFLTKKLFIEEFFHFIFPSSILGPVHLSN